MTQASINFSINRMKPKILIVDDQPEVYKAIKMFLGSAFEFIYFKKGSEALNQLDLGFIPDVILTDIKMPGFDGYELLLEIKKNERFCKIPVVIISNLEASKEKARFISAGASDYLEKPFTSIDLRKRILNVIPHN